MAQEIRAKYKELKRVRVEGKKVAQVAHTKSEPKPKIPKVYKLTYA